MAAITDWVSSLSRHGFERIYFLNGHGGNVATIEATFSEIYAEWSFVEEAPPFILKLKNWWDLPGVTWPVQPIFPTGHGMHATPSEIAVTQAAYPDRIKTAEYSPPRSRPADRSATPWTIAPASPTAGSDRTRPRPAPRRAGGSSIWRSPPCWLTSRPSPPRPALERRSDPQDPPPARPRFWAPKCCPPRPR
jgi:creatinine amidohydrolase/Fe(II)-dependent formamide hydrolase-like protein